MHKYIGIIILTIFIGFSSCRKPTQFSDNEALKVSFSTDTVAFDTVFTTIGSSTRQLMIYNNNEENLKISSIRLENGELSQFRINVDGQSGHQFSDVEIYAKDSIYVFVRVTINPNDLNNPFFVEDKLIFETNNNKQNISLTAYGQNANYIIGTPQITGFPKFKIVADSLQETHWTAEKPYVVYGYALIDSYGTLVIEPGTQIHFHNGSGLCAFSESQLRVEGTPENPVVFQGDRLEDFYADKPGQWDRIWLMEARENHGHSINNAIIKNGFIGIQAESFLKVNKALLKIHNTIIDNHTGVGIYTNLYNLKASNFVISNCGNYAIALTSGGEYIFDQGTVANYWNQSTRTTPSLFFNNIFQDTEIPVNFYFEMNNSIMYGNQEDEFNTKFISGSDTTYTFNNCILRTKRNNDINYNECLFNTNPKFVNKESDYHLDTLSPAIGLGNPKYSTGLLQFDLDGVMRGNQPDAGAYQYVPIE